eukprot:COSAG01_NODE_5208_length_4408_cov_25.878394_3_plen_86_part_00
MRHIVSSEQAAGAGRRFWRKLLWNCGWVPRILYKLHILIRESNIERHRSIRHVRPRLTITNSEPMLPADKNGLQDNLRYRKYSFI